MTERDEQTNNNPTTLAETLPDGDPSVSDPNVVVETDGSQNQNPEAAPSASSALRAEASRRNGCKSLGPATEEGKSRSRTNALKHGMRAEILLLGADSGGQNAALQALRARVEQEFPAWTLEEELLRESVVHSLWQRERCFQYESRELSQEMIFHGPVVDRILRYGTAAEKRLFRAIAELKQLQKQNLAAGKDLEAGEGEE